MVKVSPDWRDDLRDAYGAEFNDFGRVEWIIANLPPETSKLFIHPDFEDTDVCIQFGDDKHRGYLTTEGDGRLHWLWIDKQCGADDPARYVHQLDHIPWDGQSWHPDLLECIRAFNRADTVQRRYRVYALL